jgi:hypothetical protein
MGLKKWMAGPAMALTVAAALMLGFSIHGTAQAQSPDTDKPAKAKTKKKKAATSAKGGSTKFMPGSQETSKERSARLKRECKGAVNAGACEGYTR